MRISRGSFAGCEILVTEDIRVERINPCLCKCFLDQCRRNDTSNLHVFRNEVISVDFDPFNDTLPTMSSPPSLKRRENSNVQRLKFVRHLGREGCDNDAIFVRNSLELVSFMRIVSINCKIDWFVIDPTCKCIWDESLSKPLFT